MLDTASRTGARQAGGPEGGTAGVGPAIRALRKSRAMTLADLAGTLDRSVGWLSQVERGVAEPAIRDLRRIAAEFSLPLGFFFSNDEAPEAERGWIVRAAARRPLGDGEDGLVEELLSPDLGGSFELIRSVFKPGTRLEEPVTRKTEEAGYLISGTLEIELRGTWFTLTPGDSFRFEGEPMRWRNSGDEAAVVIWAIAPPVY